MRRIILLVALLVGLLPSAVSADPVFDISGYNSGSPVSGNIPNGASNDLLLPLGLSNPLAGYYEATILLSGGPAYITATYHGAESGFINSFWLNGTNIFTENNENGYAAPYGTYTTPLQVSNGVVNFQFTANTGPQITNGEANNGATTFFASVVGNPNATQGQSIWLFFDDSGANVDDNHDDMVIQLSVTAVPVPPTFILLGVGLAGVGLTRLRRRGAAVAC